MAMRPRGRAVLLVAILALVSTAPIHVRGDDEFGTDERSSSSSSPPPPRRERRWPTMATEMTGDQLAASIHSGADVVPHLVKFYATWCSKCRQMSPDFDTAADRLTRGANAGTNKFVVASVAESAAGSQKLFGDLEIKSYPHVAMFYKGKVFTHAGKDRSAKAFIAFAERDFAKYPSREFTTSLDAFTGEHVSITLSAKPWHVDQTDKALMFIMYMRDDLRGAVMEHCSGVRGAVLHGAHSRRGGAHADGPGRRAVRGAAQGRDVGGFQATDGLGGAQGAGKEKGCEEGGKGGVKLLVTSIIFFVAMGRMSFIIEE